MIYLICETVGLIAPQVMADVSAALPSESALRRERQARWDSDVSEGSSATEDKVRRWGIENVRAVLGIFSAGFHGRSPRDRVEEASSRPKSGIIPRRV